MSNHTLTPLTVNPIDATTPRCADSDGALGYLFFSESADEIARAKAICRECPLQVSCLEGAVARREPAGVWGGQLFVDGVIVTHKRGRGRPRKGATAPERIDPVAALASLVA